jgi:hypothetical protein
MQHDEGRKMKDAKELILGVMIAFTLRLNATSVMDAISVQENGCFPEPGKNNGVRLITDHHLIHSLTSVGRSSADPLAKKSLSPVL